MKKVLALMFLLLAAACGASPGDDSEVYTGDSVKTDPAPIGTAEQAISSVVWPNGGYGFQEVGVDDDRCGQGTGVWSGDCFVPRDKKVRFKFDLTRDQWFAGPHLSLSQYFASAAARVCQNLNETGGGWDCAVITSGSTNEIFYGGSIGNINGRVAAGVTQVTNVLAQRTTLQGRGKLAFFNGCDMRVSRTNIETFPGWFDLATWDQDHYIMNVVQHELYHCAGLPHNPTPNQLMTATSGFGLPVQDPTNAERQRTYSYFVTE
jgi:hypothetical protein